jgi:DMSO/TMAO reductase YedYZ molybdopterin-dependent catalytic subunit
LLTVAPDVKLKKMHDANPEMRRVALGHLASRRAFIRAAASGTTLTILGGSLYVFSDALTEEAQAATREDGRPRLPSGQRVLSELKPMGGQPGDPRASRFRLKVHGEVERPMNLSLADLAALSPVVLDLDVHCVTGWSVLGAKFKGVRIADLAKRAGVKAGARHVIFEAAHGYTANLPLKRALDKSALISWEMNGERLARAHGAPVRAVNPDHYFWKSPKWLTGIRFVTRDEPGYWETRGYHNNADPWKEERYA